MGVVVVGAWLLIVFGSSKGTGAVPALTYAEFLAKVGAGQVTSVTIDTEEGTIDGVLSDGTTFTAQGPVGQLPDADLAQLDEHDVHRAYAEPSDGAGWIGSLVAMLLPIGLVLAFWVWISRRAGSVMSGASAFGRNPGHVYTTERPATTFADVAGYDAVKDDIREVVDFLKDPQRFRDAGARIPKGVLLVGPPGTGKTLLARAVAGEAGVPFISVTGSDFMEMFVGVGAARVRGLFKAAREHAPSIVFLDEIDSIGRTRDGRVGGGHDEREQTLNQLLAEMDGFETSEGIVMMAATNRPDILDSALLRAGRFDRQVLVPLPSLEERLAILAVHTKDKRLGDDVDLGVVARSTPGMSGAELANLVNEAALAAVRSGSPVITASHLDAAQDRVVMGLHRSSMVLTGDERSAVAHHEAGHAIVAHLLEHADPVHKVTILPMGLALGATRQLPLGERHLYERRYLEDLLAVQLAGRAAEELACDDVSTGAANDLVEATRIARQMVGGWAMSSAFGPVAWRAGDEASSLASGRPECAEATARAIDVEVEHVLVDQHDRATSILTEHRAALEALAALLIEQETVDGEAVAEVVRRTESWA
jgi:cell division protease FtsH